jgi:hypothetical protein
MTTTRTAHEWIMLLEARLADATEEAKESRYPRSPLVWLAGATVRELIDFIRIDVDGGAGRANASGSALEGRDAAQTVASTSFALAEPDPAPPSTDEAGPRVVDLMQALRKGLAKRTDEAPPSTPTPTGA